MISDITHYNWNSISWLWEYRFQLILSKDLSITACTMLEYAYQKSS